MIESLQPRLRRRGQCYPQLTASLRGYLAKQPEAKRPTALTTRALEKRSIYAIYRLISDDRARYGAHSKFSIDALKRAASGKPIMQSTAKIIGKFLAFHTDYQDELSRLPDTKLDLATFFGMVDSKTVAVSKVFEGDYQTYAKATSIPGEATMVRRGKIKIWFDLATYHLRIKEEQFRPDIGPFTSMSLKWNGFCVVREDRLFCVMRLERTFGRVTPLFCIYNAIYAAERETKRIDRLEGISIGFDPENWVWPAAPIIYAERRNEKEIKVDFCAKDDVEDYILKKILFGKDE